MAFFRKMVTLKINIFVLCLVLVFLIGLLVAIRFHVPENLFFMLLRPSHVESAELLLPGRRGYAQLSAQEVAAIIAILNQIRITDHTTRTTPPDLLAVAECKLHFRWGPTLYLNSSGRLKINAYAIYDNDQLSEDLYWLLHDLSQTKTEGEITP